MGGRQLFLSICTQWRRAPFAQRSSIPQGHLIDVGYEEFVQQPLLHLQRIYSTQGLEGSMNAVSASPPLSRRSHTLRPVTVTLTTV